MANRFWVWGAWTWDTSTTTHWSTTSWWSWGSSVPWTADSVIFDWNSGTWDVVRTATTAIVNLDFTNSWVSNYAWTFSWSAAMSLTWNLTWSSAMTHNYTWAISMTATTTWKTIKTNWCTVKNSLSFTAASWGWTFSDNYTSTWASWTISQASAVNNNVNFNGKTFNIYLLGLSSSTARTTTFWWATFNCRTTGTTLLNFWANSTTDWNANFSFTQTIWGVSTFNWWTYNYWSISIWCWCDLTITWTWTISSLSITGLPTANNQAHPIFLMGSNLIITTLTIKWANSTRPLIVSSSLAWTIRTITAWSVTAEYVSFAFITWAWAANWNLSAITGWAWDCGNNSWITFTTPKTTTWIGSWWGFSNPANWNNWIPLAQDTAILSNDASSITADQFHTWWIDCSNITSATVLYFDFDPVWANTVSWKKNGWFIHNANVTIWYINYPTWSWHWTISCNWQPLQWMTAYPDTTGFTFSDNYNITTNTTSFNFMPSWKITIIWSGTMFGLTTSAWGLVCDLSNATEIQLTWTWALLTINASTTIINWNYTFRFTDNSVSAKSLSWWWLVYNNIWIDTGNTGSFTIVWNNTFNDLKATVGRTVTFTAGSNTTINSLSITWVSGTLTTLTSTTASSYTITKTAWVCSNDYVSVSKMTASTAWIFYMWVNSTNWWTNTNVNFTAPVWKARMF